jgi:uncharacterized protein involved in outer membrane biogenesis
MKRKWLLRALVGLVVVLIAVFVAVAFSLDAIVKKAVERIGPKATQVDVKVKTVGVWLLGCRVELTGFVLGNPPGCKTSSAITAEDVSVRVKPGSVFSDKLVVESINLKELVITLEGGLRDNNLKKIEKNLNDYVGSASTPPGSPTPSSGSAKPERKLQVNDLVIAGAKLQVNTMLSGGRTITLSIPDIHLTDLGSGPEGITAVEVGQRTLRAVLEASTTAIAKNAVNLGNEGAGGAKNAAQKAADTLKGVFH